ncbi:putative E3 ubiquitin-protein ligase HERC2 [Diplonema papillatum]|nr:putative E3 ubiquitin-protein ligase HERC2 [Diplonema papillatum]
MGLPFGHDLIVCDPSTLEVVGHISADGSGSIPTEDNRYTALALAASSAWQAHPTVVAESMTDQNGLNQTVSSTSQTTILSESRDSVIGSPGLLPNPAMASPASQLVGSSKKGIESRVLTDGRYLYLVSGHAQLVAKDELGGLAFTPAAPTQCRTKEKCVTVTAFDPKKNLAAVRTVVLTGPKPSVLTAAAAKRGKRSVLHLCKDACIDASPVSEKLSSSVGHLTVEMWMRSETADESKNVYVHGDKSSGGEVFIDMHSLDNGWYVKGGARVEVRNGVRSCGAVASLPSRQWVHLALVFDGRWTIYVNGALAGISRAEDTPVVVSRPTKRWLIGSSLVGSLAEVRVWKIARPPIMISRDMSTPLTGNESGLVAYWPMHEGQGRLIYDWASNHPRHNGWIANRPHPSWRQAVDFPMEPPASLPEPEGCELSPWQLFLPSVEQCGMCANGRQLAVMVPEVEDVGAGQKCGLALFFSLEDGAQLPRNHTVAPPVDGLCHFDSSYNGVWYVSMAGQVLCWSQSECAVPPPLRTDWNSSSEALLSPLECAARLADAMDDRACQNMDHAWPCLYRALCIDPSLELFQLLRHVLQAQFKRVQTARRASIFDDPHNSRIALAVLRLLRANFRVARCNGLDPKSLDLSVVRGAKNEGHHLYQQLITLTDMPKGPVTEEAVLALREGLPLFFTPEALRDMQRELLASGTSSTGAHAATAVLEAVCSHMAGFKQSLDLMISLQGDPAQLSAFLLLLMRAAANEMRCNLESRWQSKCARKLSMHADETGHDANERERSPITAVLIGLQAAILGSGNAELICLLLEHHSCLLEEICRAIAEFRSTQQQNAQEAPPDDFYLELLRSSASGQSVGSLVIAVPITARDCFASLPHLKKLASLLEDLGRCFPSVQAVESNWSANWTPASSGSEAAGLPSMETEDIGGTVSSWIYCVRLTIERVAASVAGNMVKGLQIPDSEKDPEVLKWIESPLFAGGLRDSSADIRPRLCDEIAANVGQGKITWDAVKSNGTHPKGAVEIDSSLRHIFAVLVREDQREIVDPRSARNRRLSTELAGKSWNTGEQKDADEELDNKGIVKKAEETECVTDEGRDASSIPPGLHARFRRVEALKGWLMHVRHDSAPPPTFDVFPPPPVFEGSSASGNAALNQLVERCLFALRFHPGPAPENNKVVLRALASASSTASKRSSRCITAYSKPNHGSWKSIFHSWRALKKLQRLLGLNAQTDTQADSFLELLLSFLTAPEVNFARIEKAVREREEKGRLRAEGLRYLTAAVTNKAKPIKLEALAVVAETMSRFHYADGLKAAGPFVVRCVQESVYALLHVVLAPLASSTPPNDSISQVQCNLILKLFHCRWDSVDFAYLRSMDLPKTLFSLVALWNPDGTEKLQQPASNLWCKPQKLQAKGSPGCLGDPRPRTLAEASVEVASGLFSACALKSALSLARYGHPGATKASLSFLSQVLECIARDLKLSVQVLKSNAEQDRAKRHEDHVAGLLAITARVLQALADATLENSVLGDLLPLLASCVFLPAKYVSLAQCAMACVRYLLPHFSTERAEQGLAQLLSSNVSSCAPTSPFVIGTGKACISTAEVSGRRVVQLLVEIAGGRLHSDGEKAAEDGGVGDRNEGEEEGFGNVAGREAVSLLRHLFVGNRSWQHPIAAWLRSMLADVPDCTSLADKKTNELIVALNVLCDPATGLVPGVSAEHQVKGTKIKTPVIVVSAGSSQAVVVGSDLGLSSDEMKVDPNALRVPEPAVTEVDPSIFAALLAAVIKILQSLNPKTEFCGFPRAIAHAVPSSHVISKMLRCLARHMENPLCAKLVLSEPNLLHRLAHLAQGRLLDVGDQASLEEKSLYLHQILETRDVSQFTGEIHVPRMQSPPCGKARPGTKPSSETAPEAARRQAAEELCQILRGFGPDLCMRALDIVGDDKDKAAAVLMDSADEIAAAVHEDQVKEIRRRLSSSGKLTLKDAFAPQPPEPPLPLTYTLAFGPIGTGFACLPLSAVVRSAASPPLNTSTELLFRITGSGVFKKRRLHSDVAPVVPLRVLSSPAVDVFNYDGSIQVMAYPPHPRRDDNNSELAERATTASIPHREDWIHVVVAFDNVDEKCNVWCNGKLVASSCGIAEGHHKRLSEQSAQSGRSLPENSSITAAPEEDGGSGNNESKQVDDEVLLGPGLAESASELHPCVVTEIGCFRLWGSCLSNTEAETLSLKGMSTRETEFIPCEHSLLAALTMREGCGTKVASDVRSKEFDSTSEKRPEGKGEDCETKTQQLDSVVNAQLSGAVRWSCVLPPPVAPENCLMREIEDVVDGYDEDSDVPRTEWASTFQAADTSRIANACCLADISLSVLYARQALRLIAKVFLSPERAHLWGINPSDYFNGISPQHAAGIPSILAASANLTATDAHPSYIEQLHLSIRTWLTMNPSTTSIHQFIAGCLSLLELPPDTYFFETPSHPFVASELILQTIDIPGSSSYKISFDPRCKALDYLHLYTDRSQKVQIAKFPDTQGRWRGIEVDKHAAFAIKFSGDAAAPSSWGYLFCVAVKTPKLNLACEMLLALLGDKNVVQNHGVCTNVLVSHLAAIAHKEVGARREKVVEVLTVVFAKLAQYFSPMDRPLTQHLLCDLKRHADAQYVKERTPRASGCVLPRRYSSFVQSQSELFLAADFAEQLWSNGPAESGQTPDGPDDERGDEGFYNSKATMDDAARRCYVSPTLRPCLKASGAFRCATDTAIRGRSLLYSEGQWVTVQATSGVVLGKYYYEARMLSPDPVYVGYACEVIDTPCGECSASWSYCGNRGYKWHGGDRSLYPSDGVKWKGRDVVGVLLDLFTREIEYTLNGKRLGVAFSGLPAAFYFPTVTVGSSAVELNLGDSPFSFAPPPGYLPYSGFYGHDRVPGGSLPVEMFGTYLQTCTALLSDKPVPLVFSGLEKDTLTGRLTREGTDFVEVLVLEGRPRVEGLLAVQSLANSCSMKATAKVSRLGKWYYEATLLSDGLMQIGWVTDSYAPDLVRSKGVGDDSRSWAFDGCRLLLRHRKEHNQVAGARTWREGDIIGCLLDLDSSAMRFTLNGEPVVCASQSTTAFSNFNVSDWFSPAASLDPDNGIVFNFGQLPFVYIPYGYRGIEAPCAIRTALEDQLQPPLRDALPSAFPFKSSFELDAVIVSFVDSLCESQKQPVFNLKLKELLLTNSPMITEHGLKDIPIDQLHARIVLLRHFNQLFRLVYPFINLSAADRPSGLLAEAALKCKKLLLATTTHTILQCHVQTTNAMREPIQAKVLLNRRKAQLHRANPGKCRDGSPSLFGQLHTLLGEKHTGMYFTTRRFWSVTFQGEGAEDVGGPYRECLAEVCNELMSPAVPLFIPSANAKNNIGTHRDRMVLNPSLVSHQHESMLTFLGKLMAACMRAGEPLPLYLSPVLWKVLACEPLTVNDLESVDKSVLNSLLFLLRLGEEGISEEPFKEVYDGVFTTEVSGDVVQELLPGGAQLPVTYGNRSQYVHLAIQKRLVESRENMLELAKGFYSILPAHITHLFTSEHLEKLVCGSPVWDITELRANARYEGFSPDDKVCRYLWLVLEDLSIKDRSLFLRFVSGRERAPVRLKIMPLLVDSPDSYLPVASTCFFWISLPDYSSKQVLKEKLLYAIRHCTDIDTDYRVRGSIDENAPPTLGIGEPPDDEDFEDYSHLL